MKGAPLTDAMLRSTDTLSFETSCNWSNIDYFPIMQQTIQNIDLYPLLHNSLDKTFPSLTCVKFNGKVQWQRRQPGGRWERPD